MSSLEVLSILTLHFIGDFVFQSNEVAKQKSTNYSVLFYHASFYSSVIFLGILCLKIYLLGFQFPLIGTAFKFFIITLIIHFITDFYTSKVNKQFYEEGKTHQFFVGIGFDQLLHFVQLIVTYNYV